MSQITVTKFAAEKIKEIADKEKKSGYGLKLYVYPGGCSGFQYGLNFEQNATESDVEFQEHGVRVFVDKESMVFLEGVKIDYLEGLQGSGFKIDNPNVSKECHCGKSFC